MAQLGADFSILSFTWRRTHKFCAVHDTKKWVFLFVKFREPLQGFLLLFFSNAISIPCDGIFFSCKLLSSGIIIFVWSEYNSFSDSMRCLLSHLSIVKVVCVNCIEFSLLLNFIFDMIGKICSVSGLSFVLWFCFGLVLKLDLFLC